VFARGCNRRITFGASAEKVRRVPRVEPPEEDDKGYWVAQWALIMKPQKLKGNLHAISVPVSGIRKERRPTPLPALAVRGESDTKLERKERNLPLLFG